MIVTDMNDIEHKRQAKEFICMAIDNASCFSVEVRNQTVDREVGLWRDKIYAGLESIEIRFPVFACMMDNEKYFMEGVEVEI